MKVFLDTNVLVSAFATRGLCVDVVRLVLARHRLVVGERVLAELRRVLKQKMRVPDKRVRELEAFLRLQALVVKGTPRASIQVKVRDADDARVLAEAVAGEVDVLVTGDKDLLEIAGQVPFRVLTPRGFWEYRPRTEAPEM